MGATVATQQAPVEQTESSIPDELQAATLTSILESPNGSTSNPQCSSREVLSLLQNISPSQPVGTGNLADYLRNAGLEANSEEVDEMISMLDPELDSLVAPTLSNHHGDRDNQNSLVSSTSSNRIGDTRAEDETLARRLAYEYARERSEMRGINRRISLGSRNSPVLRHSSTTSTPTVAVESQNLHSNPRESLDATSQIWQAFFNRSFLIGEQSCRSGVLPPSAVEQRESWVFLALPALTLLEVCAEPVGPDGSLVLGPGMHVANNAAHPWDKVFVDLCEVRAACSDNALVSKLRLACAADPDGGGYEDDFEVEVTRLRGLLQSAATALTQTNEFRSNYEGVLDLVEAVVCTPDEEG